MANKWIEGWNLDEITWRVRTDLRTEPGPPAESFERMRGNGGGPWEGAAGEVGAWGREGEVSWERGKGPRRRAWPTLLAGESRPQDSKQCSWSELKHAQGSRQQQQESGEEG